MTALRTNGAARGQIRPLLRKASYFAGQHEPRTNGTAQPATTNSEMQFQAIVCTERYVNILLPNSARVIEEVLIAHGGEFPSQVPLFDNHLRMSVQNMLGKATGFRRDESLWYGTGEFTPDVLDAREAWQRVKAGHLTDVSIGYRVLDYIEIPPGQSKRIDRRLWRAGRLLVRVATRWRVMELSLATIGADECAKIETPRKRQAPPRSYWAK